MRTLILPFLVPLAGCVPAAARRGYPVTNAERSTTAETSRRKLKIELLALDLDTCGRCTRTDANLERAIRFVADVLRDAEVDVTVERTLVRSAEQAERLRFGSSPTIRVDGRDIALELRASACADCGEIAGCAGGVDCRVWIWRGKEYVEAPTPMIVDALLRAYARADGEPKAPAEPFHLPDNLRRFFASVAERRGGCCPPSGAEPRTIGGR